MCSDIADLRGADTLQCVSFTFPISDESFWQVNDTVHWHCTYHSSEPQKNFFPLELLSLVNLVTGAGNGCHINTWAEQRWLGQSPVRAESGLRKREACAAHCPA